MLFDDQESCTSPNSQDFGQVTSANILPSITAGDIATGQFTIDMLFDEVLLEIFVCYVEESRKRDAWNTLACVCRRWRSIAFGSPHRLNLRIFCSDRKEVRKNLDLWPPFPIVLTSDCYGELGEENILATLEHHDRVCQIGIWHISSSIWEKILPLMQKPFPILTDLNFRYGDEMVSVIPNLFSDGSAPRLRSLQLEYIPFPGVLQLLLSTTGTHLVHLTLDHIPDSGYISAEAIVTCLPTLTRLESFRFHFESPQPRPEWERRRTSPPTRALLPSLTYFSFKGVSEYLEYIVDRIDAPRLNGLKITFDYQPILDTPRLAHFISCVPRLKTCNEARIRLEAGYSIVKVLSPSTNAFLRLEVLHRVPDFLLSSLVQLCTSSFPRSLISMVEGLIIVGSVLYMPLGQGDLDPSLWRDLLRPFTAVKDLYLFPEIAPHIALVLQELVGGNVLEIFPVLQNIFLNELELEPSEDSELVQEGIQQFIAARRLASYPISISSSESMAFPTW